LDRFLNPKELECKINGSKWNRGKVLRLVKLSYRKKVLRAWTRCVIGKIFNLCLYRYPFFIPCTGWLLTICRGLTYKPHSTLTAKCKHGWFLSHQSMQTFSVEWNV
jgi:hypothetical protein